MIHFSAVALALIGCQPDLAQVADDDVAPGDSEETDEADTETSVGEGESESESGMESSGFVPDIIEIGPACDPFMQDCPAGEKCVPYSSDGGPWDSNKCVLVTGDGQPGDTCISAGPISGADDCGDDSICWDAMDIDGALTGVCTSFCAGTANDPSCGPQTSCLIANEGSITLCITTCDPLLQDCSDGLGCFWANDDFNCVFTTDEIPTGEPCGYINDCAPGNLCVDAASLPACSGSACCAPYCDLIAPTCGVAETECVTFFEEGLAPPGYEDVGICVLPG